MSFREQFQEKFREQISRVPTLTAGAARRAAQVRARASQAAASSGLNRRLNWRTLRHAAAAASEMRPKWQPQAWLARMRDFRRRGSG